MLTPRFRSLKELDETKGTVSLVDSISVRLYFTEKVVADRHKHERGTDIILVPQPSDDINDPLNRPAWKKGLSFSIICIFTFLVSWTLGGLSTALVQISEGLKADLNATVHGTISWVSLTIGLGVNSLFISLD
jgi:hypothetical protein